MGVATVEVPVVINYYGHPDHKENGPKKQVLTVNTHHELRIKYLPIDCAWDKHSNKWKTPQIVNGAALVRRPMDGKPYRSIPEYLFMETNKRCIRRKDTNVLDFSANNLKL